MGLAHTLWKALAAIHQANRVLTANGMTPAMIPTAECEFADRLAFAEVTTALREPGRQLVALLHNRSAQLAARAADAAELDAIAEAHTTSAANPLWGAF